ncbi:MAG TPA: site-specific integrase [Acidimicrobiales bacterium]|nr:site-specific integrase [Acidimicrobiales bacterium]
MATRRNGAARRQFGSTEELPSGRWRVRYRVNGQEVSPGLMFATRADAANYLEAVRAEIDSGGRRSVRAGRRLFGDWAREYLATKVELAPRTAAGYQGMLKNHILPAFGDAPLNEISPLAIRRFLADLAANGHSAVHRRTIRMLFCQILQAAVTEGLIPNTPCLAVKPPRVHRPPPKYLTHDEVVRLLDALTPPWDLLVMTMVYGGLRYCEAAALRRSSCDIERSRLFVDESMVEVDGRVVFGPTKTHQHRFVSIPEFVRDRLAIRLLEIGSHPQTLVFTTRSGQPARYSHFRYREWVPATRAAGLAGITTHICRHTAATLLLAAGAAVKDVQMHLGHKDATITLNVYCAPFDGKRDELAARIDTAWRRARAGP